MAEINTAKLMGKYTGKKLRVTHRRCMNANTVDLDNIHGDSGSIWDNTIAGNNTFNMGGKLTGVEYKAASAYMKWGSDSPLTTNDAANFNRGQAGGSSNPGHDRAYATGEAVRNFADGTINTFRNISQSTGTLGGAAVGGLAVGIPTLLYWMLAGKDRFNIGLPILGAAAGGFLGGRAASNINSQPK
jgi:hypothetical protein